MVINSTGQSFYSESTSRSGIEEVFFLPGTNVQSFTRSCRLTLEPKEPRPLTTPIFKLHFSIIFVSTLDFVCLLFRLYVPPSSLSYPLWFVDPNNILYREHFIMQYSTTLFHSLNTHMISKINIHLNYVDRSVVRRVHCCSSDCTSGRLSTVVIISLLAPQFYV